MSYNIKTTPRTRCLARRTGTTDGHLTFGDKKHNFYTEERCSRLTCLESNTLCSVCFRNSSLSKSGYAGLMTEPIPKISHIYGGEWYKTKVLLWGEPSADHLAVAKEFQRIALATAPVRLVAAPPVKTRVFKVISDADSVAEPLVAAAPVKKRVMKVVKQDTPVADAAARFLTGGRRRRERDPLPMPLTISPLAIESTEAPLVEGDLDENGNEITVKRITIKKTYIDILGRDCYVDKDSGDAYEILENGGVGKKIDDNDV